MSFEIVEIVEGSPTFVTRVEITFFLWHLRVFRVRTVDVKIGSNFAKLFLKKSRVSTKTILLYLQAARQN